MNKTLNFQTSDDADTILDTVQGVITQLQKEDKLPANALVLTIPIHFEVAKRAFVVICSAKKNAVGDFVLCETNKSAIERSIKAQKAVWN